MPAVLAILKVACQYAGLTVRIAPGGGGAYSFTSLRRPGRTCHCQQPSSPLFPSQSYTYHSNHLVQHLDLVVGVAVAVALSLAKSGRFRKTFARLPNRQLRHTSAALAAVISHRSSPKLCESAIDSPTTHRIIHTMASRSSVARAARQLTSAVAKRPSPFACQQWRQTAQMPRLFTVSAQRMFFRASQQRLVEEVR